MLHSVLAVDKSRNTSLSSDAVAGELGIRPLNARSVALSTLLGTHPPELPVAAIVGLAGAFGIADGTMRTALSRMVAAGEVESTDGNYRLAGRLVERQREQDAGRALPAAEWDGTWWTATFMGLRPPAADRRRFRVAMAGARMGELRPGAWMRPANMPVSIGISDVVVVRGTIAEGDPAALVARVWDLDATETRARRLRAAVERATADLSDDESDGAVARAFTAFAACLQFLRTEPQLPPELAPSPAATALRIEYAAAEPQLQARLRQITQVALGSAEG